MTKRRSKKNCNINGCREEHHARGYCNRHYKKFMSYADPLAGKFNVNRGTRKKGTRSAVTIQHINAAPIPAEKRPAIKRAPEQPFSFLVNQKMIDKLYKECVKALHEPLYKAHNGDSILLMLSLALKLAGYDEKDTHFQADIVSELEEWASHKDSLRFMDTLATWQQRYNDYVLSIRANAEMREQLSIVFPH